MPTLTSVSRQAIFSGLKPREFADTIESTAPEPNQWARFWQDHGLRANEVLYRKGINNILTPMGKYIDRDYVQFQVRCTIFNK